MKPTILIALLSILALPFHGTLACGDHNNLQSDQGEALIHQSFYQENDFSKQFPDMNTNYDSNNRNHRGIYTWSTQSLNDSQTLALTYDDGPHPTRTPRLLDILKRYNVKATFFVMGELAAIYPNIIKRMVAEGHIVASHDWRHDNSNSESRDVFKWGLRNSILEVRNTYTGPHTYYRFPYGAYARAQGYHHFNVIKETSQELFGENCINFAFWDIDTSDWVSQMSAANIVETLWANLFGGRAWRFRTVSSNGRTTYIKEPYTISNPRGGGVVLMHDIHERTVDATERFLKESQTQNINFVLLKDVEEFDYGNLLCQLL